MINTYGGVNNNLEFLDIITIISFILQVQNRESHKIDQLRDEMSNKVDKKIQTKLDLILKELQEIKEQL